jgi:integrase
VKLTKSSVAAAELPEGKTDHVFWDDELPGFGLRLRGDSKRWLIQYRVGGRQGRESLGDVRKITLEDARKVARQRFAQIELGFDPAAEKAAAKTAAAAAQLTLGVVASRYLAAKEGVLRPSTYRGAVRYFDVHWRPLCDRPLGDIRRADVALRLQELIKNHGRVSAARAREMLSALFTWAMGEGLCEQNPVLATNNPGIGIQPRERVLSDNELAAVWNACDADDFGRIVKLLMLTGCRRAEIGGLRWDELDLDAGVLRIPGSRIKNRRALTLPLPAAALEVLGSIPRADGKHVFGRGFSSWSAATAELRARITVPHFTLHDIRRSVRTGMGRLGVPPHVAELVINHVRGGIQAIYDKHTYEREIGQALAVWARYVAMVIDSDARAAHEAYLARGDKKARDKAQEVFDAAIAEGGASWNQYLKMVASRGKLVPLRA